VSSTKSILGTVCFLCVSHTLFPAGRGAGMAKNDTEIFSKQLLDQL
jgi:hypothetical protein